MLSLAVARTRADERAERAVALYRAERGSEATALGVPGQRPQPRRAGRRDGVARTERRGEAARLGAVSVWREAPDTRATTPKGAKRPKRYV